MRKTTRIALLTGVAIPFSIFGTSEFSVQLHAAERQIIVAQADGVAAAQAQVEAAHAALEEAQASGGDVAAAQARLDAALQVLAVAEAAAQKSPEPQPEAEPQSQPAPEIETQPEPPSETEAAPAPSTSEQPPALELPPTSEQPQENPPAAEAPTDQPAVQEPSQPIAPETPPQMNPEPSPGEPDATGNPPEGQTPSPDVPAGAEQLPPPETQQTEPSPSEQRTPANDQPAPAEAPATTGEEQTAPVLPPPEESGASEQRPAAPAQGGKPMEAEAPKEITQQQSEESAVEQQLEAQGDEKAVENVRSLREKLREDLSKPSGNDQADREQRRDDQHGEDARQERDRDGRDSNRERRERPDDEGKIVFDFGGRFIVELGDQLVIRQDSAYESDRFLDRARDVNVEHFPGGYTRTAITRRDGSTIYTVRNRYGDIITRTRVDQRGRVIVLIDNREYYRDGGRPHHPRYEDELPPLRLEIPRDQYIVETSRVGRDDIRAALLAPPVEAVEHPYSLEEVRDSERLREKVRRIDLNTITFDFGSAAVSPSQFDALAEVGWAIESILAKSPNEIFLVEGHTDAVGSDTDNLFLSDRRAEAIAVALSTNFDIPPENLVTQGYGEQYHKVPTQEAERENRRVTVRRITPLVAQAK